MTVIAIWKGASDLEMMVYGQHPGLGQHLHQRVTQRKEGSRSTQVIGIERLIREWGFTIICPPGKSKQHVIQLLVSYQRSLFAYAREDAIKEIQDIQ
jgi:hypothetical protein